MPDPIHILLCVCVYDFRSNDTMPTVIFDDTTGCRKSGITGHYSFSMRCKVEMAKIATKRNFKALFLYVLSFLQTHLRWHMKDTYLENNSAKYGKCRFTGKHSHFHWNCANHLQMKKCKWRKFPRKWPHEILHKRLEFSHINLPKVIIISWFVLCLVDMDVCLLSLIAKYKKVGEIST